MNALEERRHQDVGKLRALGGRSRGKIELLPVRDRPLNEVHLLLHYRTALSGAYPDQVLERTRLHLLLAANYPFVEPVATLQPVPFHPNIWPSGRICLGMRWIATEGLDLLVQRIVRIVTFSPDVLNLASPANGTAAAWYPQALRRHPESFPTEPVALGEAPEPPKIGWTNLASSAPRPPEGGGPPRSSRPPFRIVPCARCGIGLRVPAGRAGAVRCVRCGTVQQVSG